jgi:hypothetical protein
LWTERPEIVRLISLQLEHLSPGWLAEFREPAETSVDLLAAYLRALADGSLHPNRNQLLHHIALHHVSAAMARAQSGDEVSADIKEFAKYARTAVTQPELRSLLKI